MVTAHLRTTPGSQSQLTLVVEDSGAGASAAALKRGRDTGVGLNNVERRLQCLFGDAATLTLRTAPGRGTTVEIRLPAGVALETEPVPAGSGS